MAHSNTGKDLRRANTGLTPSDEWVNEIANNAVTGALQQLAENPTCQSMIAAEGAVAPL